MTTHSLPVYLTHTNKVRCTPSLFLTTITTLDASFANNNKYTG